MQFWCNNGALYLQDVRPSIITEKKQKLLTEITHAMQDVYKEHPVFVLACCIFKKSEYINKVKPAFSQLKFDFWGHNIVVFHSHRIRKQRDEFRILNNQATQERFLNKMNEVISQLPFKIVATAIDIVDSSLKDTFGPRQSSRA